jgi:kynurenine formamidase
MVGVTMSSCQPSAASDVSTPPLPAVVIDLSPTVSPDLPIRSVGPALLRALGYRESTSFETVEGTGALYYRSTYVTLFTHAGPHIDAPGHMLRNGRTLDTYSLDTFLGPMRVFDLRDHPSDQPRHGGIPREVFEGSGIEPGDVVIAFVGYRPPLGDDDLPAYAHLSPEAAAYLAGIPVRLFGTDAPSVDGGDAPAEAMGTEALAPVHHAFLSRGIPVVESLANLEQVVGVSNALFVGFPLRIENGEGSPIRAAAFIYSNGVTSH